MRILVSLFLLLGWSTALIAQEVNYAEAYEALEELQRKDQYRSALTALEPIEAQARRTGDEPQIVKAFAYRLQLEAALAEDGLLAVIPRAEARLAEFPAVSRAIVESLLGQFYYQYLQQNYYRLADQAPVADPDTAGIETWSADQLSATATAYYLASVAHPETRETAVTTYAPILDMDERGSALRPTLYDVLAHRAIDHFRNNNAYLTEPVYRFQLTDSVIFASATEFVAAEFPTRDSSSFRHRSLLLFQELLGWRLDRAAEHPDALLDADRKRLDWARQQYQGDGEPYPAALERMIDTYRDNPFVAELLADKAEYLYNTSPDYAPLETPAAATPDNRWREARELALRIVREYPETAAAARMQRLIASIEQQALSIAVESAVPIDRPGLVSISYRNVPRAYLKLVSISEEEYLSRDQDYEGKNTWRVWRGRAGVQEERIELIDPGDFREHRTEVQFAGLSPGTYALLVADNPDYATEKGLLAHTVFWVSDLAAYHLNASRLEHRLYVVDRMTGEPQPGVDVEFWEPIGNRWDAKNWRSAARSKTDANGSAAFPDRQERYLNYRVRLQRGEDVFYPTETITKYRESEPAARTRERTHFFLDRGLYRPGQRVYFKGLALRFDAEDRPQVIPDQEITVTLYDANNQELASQTLRSNEFGSIAGHFDLPGSGNLSGRFSLRSGLGESRQYFQVEEYKRPRFEVVFDTLSGQPSLGDTITLTGSAQNYAGPALQDVAVTYRVTRTVRFPWFYGYFRGPRSSGEVVVATGITRTDAAGDFAITFPALDDPGQDASPWGRPLYRFEVTADVTDVTGETHAANTVIPLSRTPLLLDLQLPQSLDRSTAAALKITATNLLGQPQEVTGRLTVHRLAAPDRILVERYWTKPDQPLLEREEFIAAFPHLAYGEEDNWRSWDKTDLQLDERLTTGTEATEVALDLAAFAVGHYLAEWVVVAENGDTIRAEQYFRLSDRAAGALPTGVLLSVEPPASALEPGARNTLQLLTSQPTSHVLTVLSGRERREGPQWLAVNPTGTVDYPVTERDRGGMIWDLAYVRYNRFYRNRFPVAVPWSNKELDISFETFRDRLRPGDPETWTIRIGGPNRDAVGAEVLASMYDASLDQILPFAWDFGVWPDYRNSTVDVSGLLFGTADGQGYDARYRERLQNITVPGWEYPTLKQQIVSALYGYAVARGRERLMMARAEPAMAPPDAAQPAPYAEEVAAAGKVAVAAAADTLEEPGGEREPEGTVSPRTNLRETAFFFPQIKTDAAGNVVLSFTTPEALTRWKLQVFGHTPALASALAQREIVTQKELMILPNAPRFLREGDQIELTAKVSNLSEGELAGTATLELFDVASGASLNEAYGIDAAETPFTLAPAGSAPVAWRIDVPRAAAGSVGYRVIATAGTFSDGEENALPVLTNRILVTETQAFYVSGKATKEVALEALATATSATREDKSFTVELTSNPSWLALKSLPYLMEYPYQCTEQIVNRFFANRLASSVVAQTPRLQEVFGRWRQDPTALQSPLALNQELKSALLAETPWVLDAQDEASQRANLAILFDIERMAREQNEALAQLVQRQSGDGTYSWFPDGPPNRYMTQYVVESLIRLQQLGVLDPAEVAPANRILQRAVPALDRFLLKEYQQLQEAIEKGLTKADEDHLSGLALHYLYIRTRLDGIMMDQGVQPAYEYYLGQAETYWVDRGLLEQAMVALALNAADRPAQVNEIMQSFRERALQKEELGMYWKYARGFFWHNRPLETHTYLMEAFQELGGTAAELDAMRLWLLSHKRTNRWETTKATAAAVYALLNGMDRSWLDATPDRLRVKFPQLAKEEYADRLATGLAEAEAGTGTFRLRWTDAEVKPELATLQLRNRNKSVAWGGLYWQYLEDIDRVERAANNPLQLERQLFRRVNTDRGTELQPLTAGTILQPGDRLTVRLTIRTDRAMEFIHLKDLRGAGLEPVESLSGYRYAGGLGYYFSPTDLAVHYFIDDLPRGTYVLEYDQFVIHRGEFSNGLSTVQCMYAPEFSGHSAGTRLEVAEDE
jgi:uncharacterized protein YfaS (alpha-2-macroglobulin family)